MHLTAEDYVKFSLKYSVEHLIRERTLSGWTAGPASASRLLEFDDWLTENLGKDNYALGWSDTQWCLLLNSRQDWLRVCLSWPRN